MSAELKTPVTETKFIPFPNEATFSDCPAGEVAQVAIKSIRLPDYDFIPGHEFSASMYRTTDEDSWTGEIFSGIKCTCWFQRIYTNDFYNIVIAQFCLTSLVLGVWTLDPVDHGNRIANDFVLVKSAHLSTILIVLARYVDCLFCLHAGAGCRRNEVRSVPAVSMIVAWTKNLLDTALSLYNPVSFCPR